MSYSLWTLTGGGLMDHQVMTDITTLGEARDLAGDEADLRDTDMLIMDDETGLEVDMVIPASDWEDEG